MVSSRLFAFSSGRGDTSRLRRFGGAAFGASFGTAAAVAEAAEADALVAVLVELRTLLLRDEDEVAVVVGVTFPAGFTDKERGLARLRARDLAAAGAARTEEERDREGGFELAAFGGAFSEFEAVTPT
jgi:hypothetical protein